MQLSLMNSSQNASRAAAHAYAVKSPRLVDGHQTAKKRRRRNAAKSREETSKNVEGSCCQPRKVCYRDSVYVATQKKFDHDDDIYIENFGIA